jgi:hypothetical protein
MLERMSEKGLPGLGGLANHLLGRNFIGLSNTTAFILGKILPGVLVKMRRERVPWAGRGRAPAKESRFCRAEVFFVSNDIDVAFCGSLFTVLKTRNGKPSSRGRRCRAVLSLYMSDMCGSLPALTSSPPRGSCRWPWTPGT